MKAETTISAEERIRTQQRKHHKILVLVTADPKTAMAIRRARRVSAFLGADCFAVAVQDAPGVSSRPEDERAPIEKHLNFARHLHIETRILEGADAAAVVIDFARRNGVTQIFVTRPQGPFRALFSSQDTVHRIISRAKDMQIVIVSDRDPVARK